MFTFIRKYHSIFHSQQWGRVPARGPSDSNMNRVLCVPVIFICAPLKMNDQKPISWAPWSFVHLPLCMNDKGFCFIIDLLSFFIGSPCHCFYRGVPTSR